jgi:hypothetical protein
MRMELKKNKKKKKKMRGVTSLFKKVNGLWNSPNLLMF